MRTSCVIISLILSPLTVLLLGHFGCWVSESYRWLAVILYAIVFVGIQPRPKTSERWAAPPHCLTRLLYNRPESLHPCRIHAAGLITACTERQVHSDSESSGSGG